MTCYFFENFYYYHHFRSHRENSSDGLNSMTYFVEFVQDPPKQIGDTSAIISDNIVQSSSPCHPISIPSDEYSNMEIKK